MSIPNFMIDAKNVYRTRNYIVKQDISLECDSFGNSRLFSADTYYLRTKKLDKEFESLFKNRDFIDGRRVHSTSYSRKYL